MALVYVEQLEHMDFEQMQETHENEVKILNEIDKLAILWERGDATQSALEDKIDVYIAHVKEHFTSEEKLMLKYDFPSYDMHKTAHDMFLADLEYAIVQWKDFGDIKKIINFVRKTPEWIVLHVNSVDAPTAAYLSGKIGQTTQ